MTEMLSQRACAVVGSSRCPRVRRHGHGGAGAYRDRGRSCCRAWSMQAAVLRPRLPGMSVVADARLARRFAWRLAPSRRDVLVAAVVGAVQVGFTTLAARHQSGHVAIGAFGY